MRYPRAQRTNRRSPLDGTQQPLGPEDNQADNDPQEHLAPPDVRRWIHRERDLDRCVLTDGQLTNGDDEVVGISLIPALSAGLAGG